MTKQEIAEQFCEDHGIDIIESEITDSHIYLTLSYNDTDFYVDTDYDADSDNFEKILAKETYQALDDYDPEDILFDFGFSDNQLTLIKQFQQSADDLHDLKEDLNNELHNVHYTSFEDSLTEVLRSRAQLLISDGYKNLKLMQSYARDINIIAQSEPLYNALEKLLDQTESNANVFLYPTNFFDFITSGRNQNIISDFKKNPNSTLNRIIKENNLKRKNWTIMSQLTSQAQRLLHQQYGFRTDAESIEAIGEHSPQEVLDYEINELYNTDIPDTLNQLYDTNFKPDSNDHYDVETIDQFIKTKLNTDTYYLIWLVDEWQKCFELYAPNHIEPKTPYDEIDPGEIPFIDVYRIRPTDLLVSDLGYDGQLIATTTYPEPMHGFNY